MAYGLSFFDLVPGLRVAGDSLAYAYKFTKRGGEGDGAEGLEVGLTDDPTIKLLEASVSGFVHIPDRDVAYTYLVDGGLTELVPGLAIGIDSLSSIVTSASEVKLGVAGQQPVLRFLKASVPAITKVGDSGYTWQLPSGTFDLLKDAAEVYQSDLSAKVDDMIADRLAADGVLQGLINDQGVADADARAVLSGRIDALEADPTTAAALAAVQADVDANEADSDAAEAALSGRLDVLEADPTTATAVAAGDAATLSSANSYTDTKVTDLVNGADAALDTLKEIGDALAQGDSDVTAALTAQITTEATTRGNADTALSDRLDVLEADPTTAAAVTAVQNDVDANELASDAADSALSGRLDVLEADPTTATAVAAVQTNLDTEAGLRAAADSALDGRLDVLEADPTTATAVAAVQADVDQNEADADAALALKAPLASPDFTGQLEVDVNLRLEYDSNLTKIHNVLRGTSIEIGNNIQMKPAAAGGRVEIAGALQVDITEVPDAANDVQAAAAGVIVGGLYRSNSVLHIRVS